MIEDANKTMFCESEAESRIELTNEVKTWAKLWGLHEENTGYKSSY